MPPRPAAPELAREDERQRKLAALRTRLHDDVRALRTSGDWAARLRLAALMPGEDFGNILLIFSQRPGATLVRDYRQWTATGRQVRRHENGIETFRIPPRPLPRRPQDRDERDDREPPTWRDADRVGYVWDLSQTTGQPVTVPAGLPPPGQAPPGLWDGRGLPARQEARPAGQVLPLCPYFTREGSRSARRVGHQPAATARRRRDARIDGVFLPPL